MILKEGALRQSRKPHGKVYFISLLAADSVGKIKDEYFTFDIASKLGFKNTLVEAVDCHDLLRNYDMKIQNTRIKERIGVYELVEGFVQSYPEASFFIDECPFLISDTTSMEM